MLPRIALQGRRAGACVQDALTWRSRGREGGGLRPLVSCVKGGGKCWVAVVQEYLIEGCGHVPQWSQHVFNAQVHSLLGEAGDAFEASPSPGF